VAAGAVATARYCEGNRISGCGFRARGCTHSGSTNAALAAASSAAVPGQICSIRFSRTGRRQRGRSGQSGAAAAATVVS
jgi:hypothetical protein